MTVECFESHLCAFLLGVRTAVTEQGFCPFPALCLKITSIHTSQCLQASERNAQTSNKSTMLASTPGTLKSFSRAMPLHNATTSSSSTRNVSW